MSVVHDFTSWLHTTDVESSTHVYGDDVDELIRDA